MRIYLSLLSLSLSFILIPGIWAIPYPSTTPSGEIGSGTFNGYFTNMFTTSGCTGGQVLRGFSPTGILYCVSPTTTQYWTSTDAGVNIYFTGAGNVGIGVIGATRKLEVSGDAVINGVMVGRGSGNIETNTIVGSGALISNTTGYFNTANGQNALYSNTTGNSNTAYGASALVNNTTGYNNTAIGTSTLYYTTGNDNTAVGSNSLAFNQGGLQNSANGTQTLFRNTIGSYNAANGTYALYSNTTGNQNTANGVSSLFFNTTGYNNVAIGISALSANTTGTFNTAVGSNAGSNITTGSSNITIGETTQVVSATGSNQLNIGNWIYGTSGNIGIGTGTALTARLTVAGTVQITGGTPGVGRVLTSDASGLASWMNPSEMPIGAVVAFNTATCPTGWVAANGSGTIDLRGEFIRGLDSGRGIDISRVLGTLQTDGTRDHTHAFTALQNMNGGDGMYDHNGVSNVVGAQDQHPVSRTSGLINAGGNGGTETRPRNVALLYCTKISSSTSTVSNNLTWSNVTGTSTGDVTLATTGNVGVGTTGPTAKLEVNGQVKITGGAPGIGRVLTSDALGLASWSLPAAGTANFGQLQPHATYTDCNTLTTNWGWTFVQGSANCPNATSSQWYRGMFSLGSDYLNNAYRMELAYPRFNVATAGVWMRTMEAGVIGGWTQISGGAQWTASGSDLYRSTGNVGIGTSTPGASVVMNGGLTINGTGSTQMTIEKNGVGGYALNTNLGQWTMFDKAGGTWNAAISSSGGSIGIGTVTPGVKLDVAGQIRTGRDGVAGSYDTSGFTTTQSIWSISPTYDLNGAAATAFGNLYGMSYSYQGNGGLAGFGHQIGFHDNGGRNAAISLTNGNAFFNGNVGIGISAPTSKLDVNGPIKALGSSIWAQSNNTSTSYADAPLQVREAMYGAGAGYLAPRIGLHWGGVIASQIGLESTGRIAILNNPGTGYENFVAKDITVARLMANSSTLIGFANNVAYDISAGRIAAGNSIYSYGKICAGNSLGDCNGVGGFVADSAGNINGTAFLYSSDRTLKQNITPLSDSLSKILSLNGYSFDWKSTGKHDIGVIAQEVEKIFPALVHTDAKSGIKSVEYGNLVAPLIEAIKELAGNIRSNTAEINTLKSENAELKKRLDAIEARLAK